MHSRAYKWAKNILGAGLTIIGFAGIWDDLNGWSRFISSVGTWLNLSVDGTIRTSLVIVGLSILIWVNWPKKSRSQPLENATAVRLPVAEASPKNPLNRWHVVAVLLCLWLAWTLSAISRLELEVNRLQVQAIRYVLPRQLTNAQQDIIGAELKKYERQQVKMFVVRNDEEASSYRADIQEALKRGGWVVSTIQSMPNEEIVPGIGVNIMEPMPVAPPKPDPFESIDKKPKPNDILLAAFKKAGVLVHSSGGGGGVNITETTITISIGARRRDRFAIEPFDLGVGAPAEIQRPREYPTDDEFLDYVRRK